jgi:hypothetical protein
VPCCGTFCAFPWHISLKVFLCRVVAHFVPSPWHIKSKSLFVPCCGTFCAFLWHMVLCSLLSRITSQELQVKNCKSRIASQELQKKSFRQFGHFFSRLRPYFSTPTVITFGVSFELLLFLTSNVKFFEC